MIQFVKLNRIRHAALIIPDLNPCAERMQADSIQLSNLVNLVINHGALTPSAVLPLNEFIVAQDATPSAYL